MAEQRTEKSLLTHFTPFLSIAWTLTKPLILKAKIVFCPFSPRPQKFIKTDMKLAQQLAQTGKVRSPLVPKGDFPAARSRVACPAVGQAKADHPACSRHEGQAECQHANAPPRQVPGSVVIVARIAPRLPSQHWRQCRHHQDRLPPTCPLAAQAIFLYFVGKRAICPDNRQVG